MTKTVRTFSGAAHSAVESWTKPRKTPIHQALRLGGRHYWEIYQAWQIEKKANLGRRTKVSFFDPRVSRKSYAPWHFLAVLPPAIQSLIRMTSQSWDITCSDRSRETRLRDVARVCRIFLTAGASANLHPSKTPCQSAQRKA